MAIHVTGLRSLEKEEQLEQALSHIEKPSGVGRPNILFGIDHSGDAAVHIIYPVSTKIKLTRGRINTLARFHEAIHDQVRALGMNVIAYVRFSETNR